MVVLAGRGGAVGVEPALPRREPHPGGLVDDVGDVAVVHEVAVLAQELELEAALFAAAAGGAPASAEDVVRAAAAVDGARGGGPLHRDALPSVVRGVGVREEGDGAARLARLVEAHGGRRGEAARAEVELRGVVEVVGGAAGGAVGLVDEDGGRGRPECGGDPRE